MQLLNGCITSNQVIASRNCITDTCSDVVSSPAISSADLTSVVRPDVLLSTLQPILMLLAPGEYVPGGDAVPDVIVFVVGSYVAT